MLHTTAGFLRRILSHRYGLTLFAFLAASILTGVASVYFMRSFEWAIAQRLDFARIGACAWLTTPLIFLLCAETVRRLAPAAAGSGIPQAIFAAKRLVPEEEARLGPLFSPSTLAVKCFTVLLGVMAGASIGREGPTVQVAMSVFILAMWPFTRWLGVRVDLRTMVIAGSAAGLGAAFNTPLAGVTFAIEELSVDGSSSVKEFALMAIIVAGLSAQMLYGQYVYFGRLVEPPNVHLEVPVFIGILAGLAGAFFSEALLRGGGYMRRISRGRMRFLVPAVLALLLLLLAVLEGPQVLGPGNEVARRLTQGDAGAHGLLFPLAKLAATLLSYWSGIAGGIFAPSLSIGSALGSDLSRFMGAPVETCALIGMAAFLSATIQAPITSFIIIFEMTGHHSMLLPLMLAALLSFMVARLVGARHLYKTLAEDYRGLLSPGTVEEKALKSQRNTASIGE